MPESTCALCGAGVDDPSAILQKEVDEWMLKVIMKDHPDWRQSDGACPKCDTHIAGIWPAAPDEVRLATNARMFARRPRAVR